MTADQASSTDFSVIDDNFAAIEKGDMDALRRTFAPDARVWHNYDEYEQNVDEVIATLSNFSAVTTSREYRDRRITTVGSQAFLQHKLTAELANGTHFHLLVMMRVVVDPDGLVERIEEYFDSAALAALAEAQ